MDHQKFAQQNIRSAQEGHKTYFDQKHQAPAHSVGDLVLKSNARRQKRKGDKLAPHWTGPHEILEVRENGTIKLKGHKAVKNMTSIKPYTQPTSSTTSPPPTPTPPVEM